MNITAQELVILYQNKVKENKELTKQLKRLEHIKEWLSDFDKLEENCKDIILEKNELIVMYNELGHEHEKLQVRHDKLIEENLKLYEMHGMLKTFKK